MILRIKVPHIKQNNPTKVELLKKREGVMKKVSDNYYIGSWLQANDRNVKNNENMVTIV